MDSHSTPVLSAIVSTYNSEKFIRHKILDLINQTIFDDLEIIIVNSGSEQNEDEIIKEFLKLYNNIVYIKTPVRETIYKAWNRAIKIAKGRYVCNSNTDDRLKSDAYEIMVNFLDSNPNIGLVYADQYYSQIPNESFISLIKKQKYPKPDFSKILLLERCIIGSQPMWRRSIHNKLNIWFDEKYEIAGDYDFELNLSDKYQIKHIPQYLGVYFKSSTKTNKEFQNFEKTFGETVDIMKFYIKKYFNSSDQFNLFMRFVLFRVYMLLPLKVYNFLKSLLRKFYPRKEMHTFEFLIWYNSFYLELNCKKLEAINICRRYLNKKSSYLISSRLDQLKG